MREKRDFSERSRTLASAEVLKKYFLVVYNYLFVPKIYI